MNAEPTPMLFHYTKKKWALEHILPSGRIRLSRLPRTNDPREFLPVPFGIAGYVGEDEELTSKNPFELIEEADEHLRGSVHVLCLTEDRPVPSPQKGFGNGPLRARMWAQYGDNHSGVCLCFNSARLVEAAEREFGARGDCDLIPDRVSYLRENEYPERPRLRTLIQPDFEQDPQGYVDNLVRNNLHEFFFTKDWDWESETEYRILLRGETRDEEFIEIRESLEAVIVGQKCHRIYWPGLYRVCAELEAKPLVLQWDTGSPLLLNMPKKYGNISGTS